MEDLEKDRILNKRMIHMNALHECNKYTFYSIMIVFIAVCVTIYLFRVKSVFSQNYNSQEIIRFRNC